ncbi:hypothetical protein VC83_06018 [Pseudogymnoascus destructans]|uniref:Fungal calcium binding protein domain-containing protein n=2 Tax=Pseudogymnoascus destructans TaxID=655981 RepID=L8FTL4_PSED2|nr:uncharacterized protein VC83_06018 [Pseudogymnoascus destructans]ELR04300.1 hypothetical protein GMDG_06689 [Pseudogymnoascus destructans 20631-21]OAF57197.1 hypothetical protein VC83_06018 [Pseudogymnoascus destructans]
MKVMIVLSTVIRLGLAAPPLDARSGLQRQEEAGIGSCCLIYGLYKALKHALEKAHDPSAQKSYDSCKRTAKATGKICSAATCTAIAGTLTLRLRLLLLLPFARV